MADLKERIAKRCAKEFNDGDFINLGIGLPTMVADYTLHLPDKAILQNKLRELTELALESGEGNEGDEE